MINSFIHPSFIVEFVILAVYTSIFLIAVDNANSRLFFILVGAVFAWFWVSCATGLSIAFTYFLSNPLYAAYCFIGFILIGIVVAFFKWSSKIAQAFNFRMKIIEKMDNQRLHESLDNIKSCMPSADNHKAQISGWIVFWPLHVIDSLVDLVFHDLFDKIAYYTRDMFDYITERVTKSAIESYKKKSEQNNSKLTK